MAAPSKVGPADGREGDRMTSPEPPADARFRGLDGIRAVAIVGVLVVHAGAPFRGGAAGPELFFALSGFLITHLMLREIDRTGRLDVRRFWARRGLRIVPPLLLAIVLANVAFTVAGPSYPTDHGPGFSTLMVLLYIPNWVEAYTYRGLGYLAHTWTLGIEEQFYLVWPAVVLLLVRLRLRHRAAVLAAIILASTTFRLALLFGTDRGAIHFWTPARIDLLAMGALAALLLRDSERARRWAVRPVTGWLAATGLAAAVALYPGEEGLLVWGYSALGLSTTVLVAHLAARGTGAICTALELRPMRFVGKISYGLFLFNWPLLQMLRALEVPRLPLVLLGVGGSFLLAVASWYLLEQPLARRRRRLHAPGDVPDRPPTRPAAPAAGSPGH